MGIKISNQLEKGKSTFERLLFCPGCKCAHGFRTKEWPEPIGLSDDDKKTFQNKWSWNGNLKKPTLTPSLNILKKISKDNYETVCHFFVRDGKIQFLNDCKHTLKNKTVDLPDW